MAEPDRVAVLEAMRSDLGVGRVDDLDLENGRPGHSLRPGQTVHPIKHGAGIAPPRNPQPLASRWQEAIKKGDFDDDDAEAVKGLGRIGGGRLHAQNKPSTFDENVQFRFTIVAPPGLRPNRMSAAFPLTPGRDSIRTSRHQHLPPAEVSEVISNLGIIAHGPIRRFESSQPSVHPAVSGQALSPRLAVATPTKVTNRQPAKQQNGFSLKTSSPMPPTPPEDLQYSKAGKIDEAPFPHVFGREAHGAETPLSEDPEPTDYFHKANVHIADRRANGPGVAYLLVASPEDVGTFSIYLRGSRYLEYPVLSMFNYIANSEALCPQFKEADGTSVTTTSLVFGSQGKIAEFMHAIRSLKARNSLLAFSFIEPKTETVPKNNSQHNIRCRVTMQNTDADEQRAGTGHGGSSREQNLRASVKEGNDNDSAVGHGVGGKPVASLKSAADETGLIDDAMPLTEESSPVATTESEQAPCGLSICEDTADLLDLSRPPEVPARRSAVQSSQMSTYTADLESLDSPPGTYSETFSSDRATDSILPGNNPATHHAEAPSEVAGANAIAVVNQEEGNAETRLLAVAKSLEDGVLKILPVFEAMNNAMGSVSLEDREKVAQIVFNSIREKGGSRSAASQTPAASVRQILSSLLPRSKLSEAKPLLSPIRPPVQGPMYTRQKLLCLRGNAMPPPSGLAQSAYLPRAQESGAALAGNKSQVDANNLQEGCLQNEDVQPLGRTRHAVAEAAPPALRLAPIGKSLNAINVATVCRADSDSPRPAPKPGPLPQKDLSGSRWTPGEGAPEIPHLSPRPSGSSPRPKKCPQRGLNGSRWATNNGVVLPENENHFTGIDVPRKRS